MKVDTKKARVPIGRGLTIATEDVRGGVRIVPRGELDLNSAPLLESALVEAERSHDLVELDLRELSFMDSTGLHTLIAADLRMQERGGELVLVRDDSHVGKLLDLTRVTDHLHVVSEPRESGSD